MLAGQVDEKDLLTQGREHDEARRLWSADVGVAPAVVVRCASTADVQASVRAARTCCLTLSVLGGGYDWAGRALVQGGLVIDLSRMRDVCTEGTVNRQEVAQRLSTARAAGSLVS